MDNFGSSSFHNEEYNQYASFGGDEVVPENVEENTTQEDEGINVTNITESSKKSRERTSDVWKLFERNDVTNKAICKLCKKEYSHKPGGGTGTLDRHMKNTHKD